MSILLPDGNQRFRRMTATATRVEIEPYCPDDAEIHPDREIRLQGKEARKFMDVIDVGWKWPGSDLSFVMGQGSCYWRPYYGNKLLGSGLLLPLVQIDGEHTL